MLKFFKMTMTESPSLFSKMSMTESPFLKNHDDGEPFSHFSAYWVFFWKKPRAWFFSFNVSGSTAHAPPQWYTYNWWYTAHCSVVHVVHCWYGGSCPVAHVVHCWYSGHCSVPLSVLAKYKITIKIEPIYKLWTGNLLKQKISVPNLLLPPPSFVWL